MVRYQVIEARSTKVLNMISDMIIIVFEILRIGSVYDLYNANHFFFQPFILVEISIESGYQSDSIRRTSSMVGVSIKPGTTAW